MKRSNPLTSRRTFNRRVKARLEETMRINEEQLADSVGNEFTEYNNESDFSEYDQNDDLAQNHTDR